MTIRELCTLLPHFARPNPFLNPTRSYREFCQKGHAAPIDTHTMTMGTPLDDAAQLMWFALTSTSEGNAAAAFLRHKGYEQDATGQWRPTGRSGPVLPIPPGAKLF